MRERHDDVVADLVRLGEDLTVARPGERDPVAGALREIERSAGATGTARAPRQLARRRVRPRHRPRRAAVAAAAIVVACTAVVAAPGSRAALARLLGIGGVHIVTTSDIPADLALRYDLGESLPVERARAQAPGPLEPAGVGDALAAYAGRPQGGVTLVWATSDELPEIEGPGSSGVGLIVTAFPGSPDRPVIQKQVGPSTMVGAVTVGGGPATGSRVHPTWWACSTAPASRCPSPRAWPATRCCGPTAPSPTGSNRPSTAPVPWLWPSPSREATRADRWLSASARCVVGEPRAGGR